MIDRKYSALGVAAAFASALTMAAVVGASDANAAGKKVKC